MTPSITMTTVSSQILVISAGCVLLFACAAISLIGYLDPSVDQPYNQRWSAGTLIGGVLCLLVAACIT
jgi:hypothetical protein